MPASTFGDKLRSRREEVKMNHTALSALLDVPTATVIAWESGAGEDLTLGELRNISDALGTDVSELMPEADSDLDDGVLIQEPRDRPILPGVRANMDYYVYHCLVRTRTVPSMVPLIVDVLVDNEDDAEFNAGHAGREFIYVLEGQIQMKWGDASRPRERLLPTGASLYIQPHVPHTFTRASGSGPARLLAVNF